MTLRRPPPPPPTPDEAVFNRGVWRQRLNDEYAPTAERLTDAYATVIRRLGPLADDVTNLLLEMIDSGIIPDRSALYGMSEYQRLLIRTQYETQQFANIAEQQAALLQTGGASLGVEAARQTTARVGGRIVSGAWVQPNPQAITQMVDFVDSAAMQANFAQFGANASREIADVLITGIAQGKSPQMMSRLLRTFIEGTPYSWADNMTRTVQLYSYRYANHAAYQANARILDGWRWSSACDTRTCISCWSQHGKVFTLGEKLNDHHRGRCAPISIVRGSSMTWQTGAEIFERLPVSQQREIMGDALHAAYRRGDVNFADMSRTYNDAVYGTMRRAATLRELGVRQ